MSGAAASGAANHHSRGAVVSPQRPKRSHARAFASTGERPSCSAYCPLTARYFPSRRALA